MKKTVCDFLQAAIPNLSDDAASALVGEILARARHPEFPNVVVYLSQDICAAWGSLPPPTRFSHRVYGTGFGDSTNWHRYQSETEIAEPAALSGRTQRRPTLRKEIVAIAASLLIFTFIRGELPADSMIGVWLMEIINPHAMQHANRYEVIDP